MLPLQIPGELMMGTEPPQMAAEALRWSDLPLNRILLVVAVALFLLNLRSYYMILPHLAKCAYIWRRNISLENSIQLTRARNLSCWVTLLPLSLLVSRYRLLGGSLMDMVGEDWKTPVAIGVVAAYLILRYLLYLVIGARVRRRAMWTVAHTAAANFLVLLGAVLLVSSVLILLPGVSDDVLRAVFLSEIILVYTVFLVRRVQILLSDFHPFTTFLYLCALELTPTGILIWFSL